MVLDAQACAKAQGEGIMRMQINGRARRGEAWQRGGGALAMFALVSGAVLVHGCEKPAPCGDGVVGPGEACDDGNTVDGDGCSSLCQLDDNLSTPGDDRAGFVMCASPFGTPPVTCGPGFGCCNDPAGSICAADLSQCASPFDFQGCDGAEDCGGGPCWVTPRTTSCSAGTGLEVRCHVDADCPHAGDVCDGNGHCPTFSLPATL
jgi:cysteine-rich repeat protein